MYSKHNLNKVSCKSKNMFRSTILQVSLKNVKKLINLRKKLPNVLTFFKIYELKLVWTFQYIFRGEDRRGLESFLNLCITDYNFLDYTKLMVIGGYNRELGGPYLSSVEVIDLENPSSSCGQINDYPMVDTGMAVGIFDGLIKSCGGYHDLDYCYDYNPETNTWITSASLINNRQYPKSSFINGIWLVSGDSTNSDDVPLTTEMWTGTGFEAGPTLPIEMSYHCQLTINSTHVFFADTGDTGNAFLLDWYAQTWSALPPMSVNRDIMSCGMINSPENGIEAVIVEDGTTEIFNFREEVWRTGPTVERFDYAGYAQIGDTFVVLGGEDVFNFPLNTIYKFDHINYEWILMSQQLQVPRNNYPGVVAVPDEFVTCT